MVFSGVIFLPHPNCGANVFPAPNIFGKKQQTSRLLTRFIPIFFSSSGKLGRTTQNRCQNEATSTCRKRTVLFGLIAVPANFFTEWWPTLTCSCFDPLQAIELKFSPGNYNYVQFCNHSISNLFLPLSEIEKLGDFFCFTSFPKFFCWNDSWLIIKH